MKTRGRRNRRLRAAGGRWLATVLTVTVMFTIAVPAQNATHMGPFSFSLSRLLDWIGTPVAWGAPPMPPTPKQAGGTAKGVTHRATTAQTRAGSGAGHAPGRGAGELAKYHTPKGPAAQGKSGPSGGGTFDPATSKRQADQSSATTDVYLNADGSRTRRVYEGPANYRATDGTWQPIDLSLATGKDGRLDTRTPAAAAVTFARSAADPVLESVSAGAGQSIGYGLQGAAAVVPTVDGSTATYPSVLTGTDLQLQTFAGGYKETLVLTSADAPTSWVFPLTLHGLAARLTTGGDVQFVDAKGTVVQTTPAAFMTDSKFDPQSGEPALSRAVSYSLVDLPDGGTGLKMTADPSWIHDPARVLPIRVDPSTTNEYPGGGTYAESSNPGDNHMANELKVGTSDGSSVHAYSFLKFSSFGTDYANTHITAVRLHIFDFWAWTCTAKPFSVNPITQSWTTPGVTSYPGPSFGGSIGSVTANPGAACSNTAHNPAVGTWMAVWLDTTTFNSWARGGTNNGLAITASQSDKTQWKQFASTNTGNMPYLEVTYDVNTPPVVDQQYPPANYAAPTLTPELIAAGHDPDNFPNSTVNWDFKIYQADANGALTMIKDSGWQANGDYVVPSGVLQWGKTYFWQPISGDGSIGSDYYDAYSYLTPISTTVPQPLITSQLSQNDGHGFDPSIGNFTTSATDAQLNGVGPAVAIERNYNSRDPRVSQATGAGWSTVLDARATVDAAGNVVVTYPDGQEVGFGKNADGTFSPPSGRFATLKVTTTPAGYTLTDKQGLTYAFSQSLGTGVYGLSSVTDVAGRAETLTYTANQVTTVASSVSGRALHLTWSTPTGATAAHVATIVTDPVTAGSPATALTWIYNYTGDKLTKVCPPTSTTNCVTYTYTTTTQYPNTVTDLGPHSYWRMADPAGSATAANSVLINTADGPASYNNVTLGQPGPLPGSSGTSASFNGSSSFVQLPKSLVTTASYQSVSLWFKTSTPNGVLFSYQNDPVTNASTPNNYTPALYIGSDGKLQGMFWTADGLTVPPMASTASVADGQWHQVVLSGAGNTQSLYLDGTRLATRAGQISGGATSNTLVGAGFLGGSWPDQPHYPPVNNTGYATFYNGLISDFAVFDQTLGQSAVTALYGSGHSSGVVLASVLRPSVNPLAQVNYDSLTGIVTQVTDENGGVWHVDAPKVQGSSAAYDGAVLGQRPADYWRLSDPVGVGTAANTVHGGTATYTNTTLGAPAPFNVTDATAANFDGSSSYVTLPSNFASTNGNQTLSLWFRTTTTNGVIFSYQQAAISAGSTTFNYTPALYVGSDGKLCAGWWSSSGLGPIASPAAVTDGKWHHVVMAAASSTQTVYLDSSAIGTRAAPVGVAGQANAYLGTGYIAGAWPDQPHTGSTATPMYFSGTIADVALFNTQLTASQVSDEYDALHSTLTAADGSSLAPVSQTVKITDPGNHSVSNVYDPLNGFRQVAQVDDAGDTTTYGFDSGGFLNTTTDPNGNVTTTGHDVRGNTTSQTTCQDQVNNKCATVYFTYYPDDTTATLTTADPRNDLVLTTRDGRSASATDNTYLTSFSYDTLGNRTGVTSPAVAGSPSGRTTTTAYTDGTTVAAYDTGFAPKGLPYRATTPGGGVQTTVYYHNGDIAQVTDAAGQVTRYSYDNLGRPVASTVISNAYPAGLTTSFTFDGLGQVLTETDPPVTNQVTGAIHTARTTNVYDVDGNVLTQTVADLTGGDASRTVTTTYTIHDQVKTVTDPTTALTTYTYDAYGNRATQVDPNGVETDYTYDAHAHLLTSTLKGYTGDPNHPSAPTDLLESWRFYDPAGRLASIKDSMGWVTAYQYYDDGHVFTITRSNPATGESFEQQRNTYDAAGNPDTTINNNGATTTKYTVDAGGRTTQVALDPTGVNRTTSYTYSPDDLITSTTIAGAGGSAVTDATYDPLGRMTSQTLHSPGLTPIGRWPLNDGAGNTARDTFGNDQASSSGPQGWSSEHGGSATFNGTPPALTTAGPVVDTMKSFTVSAWTKLTGTSDTGVAVSQDGDQPAAFTLRYDQPSNTWAFTRAAADAANAGIIRARSQTTPALNTWTHLVGVYDSSAALMTLYVNGVAEATAFYNTPFPTKGSLVIGAGKWNGVRGNALQGSVSDVQVYDTALSAAQVQSVYGGTLPTAGTARIRTSWMLDQRGVPTSRTDPDGNTTTLTYDEAGRLAVSSAPAVLTEVNGGTPVLTHPITTVGYDTFGSQVESSDANGNETITVVDAAGRPLSTTLPNYTPPGSSTPITAVTSRTYNGSGQVRTAIDPLGHQTSYTYDQLGSVAKVVAPNTGVTTFTHDTNGDQLSVTDPTGAQAQNTYDWLGRRATSTQLVRQPSPAAYTTTFHYNSAGLQDSATAPNGEQSQTTYNSVGEVATSRDGAGNTTTYTYDFAGRVVRTQLPDNRGNSATYDVAGRTLSTSQLDNAGTVLTTRSQTYDPAGNVLTSTDGNGYTSTFSYDATNLLTGEVQPVTASTGISTSFGYDAAGNRTRYTDGRGNAFRYTYNSWNLPESTIEPSTAAYPNLSDRTFTTVYNAAGQVASTTAPGGVTVTNSYNAVGNLTGQTGTGADATTAARSIDYDLAGHPTSVSAPGGTDTFSWDDRGLLLSATGPSGASSFSYNSDGMMASRTDAAGTTSYTYDNDLRPSTVTNSGTGVSATYTYNSVSLPQTVSYSNGNSRNFIYNTRHLATSDTLKNSSGTTIASIAYGWDNEGQLTSKNTTGLAGAANNTYTYDRAGRLASWNNGTTTLGYGYDASGNRTQVGAQTYTYDARDELLSGNGVSYAYTARGTLKSSTAGGTTTQSTTDAFGQTITSGSRTYGYDALGRVVTASGLSGIAYTGAGNNLASDGSTLYTRGSGDNIIGEKSGSSSLIVWTDNHADVVGQFTPTGTSLAGSRSYDPLGNVLASTGMVGNLGFQSGWTDPTSGQVNMLSRWYNPANGQFTTRDSASVSPSPDSAAANPFAYVGDSPLMGTDPMGTCSSWNLACRAVKAASNVVSTAASYVSTAASYVASAASAVGSWVVSAASSAWNFVTKVASAVYSAAKSVVSTAAHLVKRTVQAANRAVQTVSNKVADAARAAAQRAVAAANDIKRAASNVVHAYVEVIRDPGKAMSTAWETAKKATSVGAAYLKAHAASIASFVVSTVAFMGCEALIGESGPAGLAVCGAISGALGSITEYAVGAAQSGKFSWGAMGKAALTGAVSGALGGVLGAVGGKVLAFAGKKIGGMLGKAATDVVEGGAEAATSDATAEAASTVGGDAAETAGGRAADEGAAAAEGGGGEAAGAEASGEPSAGTEEPASSTPEKAGCHSFQPDTKVLLADGTAKAIGDIQLGDEVASTDPVKGGVVGQPVVALHDNNDTDMADVTVQDEHGKSTTLHTTQHHPFWDSTSAKWVDAKDLPAGDALRAEDSDQHTVKVVAVKTWTALHHMRDLTVNAIHTYYVLAGTTALLVHNVDDACEIFVHRSKYPESAQHIEDAQAAGKPTQLTIDRAGADARRAESMKGNPPVSGKDRDEYPPAMFKEGGTGSSVRPIGPSDNRGAGSSIGRQCRGLPDNTVVTIAVCD